jgi:hypothetical protein
VRFADIASGPAALPRAATNAIPELKPSDACGWKRRRRQAGKTIRRATPIVWLDKQIGKPNCALLELAPV